MAIGTQATEFFPAALGPGVYSTSNRNEYQKYKKIVLEIGERAACKADNLTANVYIMCNTQHLTTL
jgi:hypothetical protein